MLRAVLVFGALAAAVVARTSPNARIVEDQYKSQKGSRYSDDVLEDAQLDVPGLITKYGYPVEVHNVVTADGYILEMHRIPYGRDGNNIEKRPIVFVMHGLLSSSADFLVLGPGKALGYLLADAGYDVWLGNARGNFYSRKHTTLNPDHGNDFWRFSWDEIGNFDLPAFIDHIFETTGQSKIHYIGHSQGGTSFLVLNSLRPEYNEKIVSFQGLAPAAFFTYNTVETYRNLAQNEAILETAAWAVGLGEIFGHPYFMADFEARFCGDNSLLASVCGSGFDISNIFDTEYNNATILPVILGHTPAGASIRQVAHYGQVIKNDAFRRYHFNLLSNLAVYGSRTAPTYDLSKVTVPTYIYYGSADNEVNYRDLFKLASVLPNVVNVKKASRDSFNHFDFLWALDATEQIYEEIFASLSEAERKFL